MPPPNFFLIIMRNTRVLVVQNNRRRALELAELLRDAGLACDLATEPVSAAGIAGAQDASLLLVDDAAAGHELRSLCLDLRRNGQDIPIIFVSENTSIEYRLEAFRSGADDFVIRPYNAEELILRISAVLRRSQCQMDCRCRLGPTLVDLETGEAVRGHHRLRLTAKEIHLLRYLWSRREQVVSKDELLRDVWEYSARQTRTVDVHVATLRRKVEIEPHRPRYLVTLRSRGYLLHCA